jgi:hypothetical protein
VPRFNDGDSAWFQGIANFTGASLLECVNHSDEIPFLDAEVEISVRGEDCIDLQSGRFRFRSRLLQPNSGYVKAGHVPSLLRQKYRVPALTHRHIQCLPRLPVFHGLDQQRVRAEIALGPFGVDAVIELTFLAKSFTLDANNRVLNRGVREAVRFQFGFVTAICLVFRATRRNRLFPLPVRVGKLGV